MDAEDEADAGNCVTVNIPSTAIQRFKETSSSQRHKLIPKCLKVYEEQGWQILVNELNSSVSDVSYPP